MKSFRKGLIHFLFFSFFIFVVCTTSPASPDLENFPPLPLDQEMPGEGFPKGEKDSANGEKRRPPHPPFDPENIIKYRGNRTYTENLPLKINQVKCTRVDNVLVSLDIVFNQSINPRSMRPESILVNNLPIPKFSKFSFNRKGDTIKILVPMNSKSFKLKINQISSFDGKEIEQVELLVEVQDS